MAVQTAARYDEIGRGYALKRREDPRILEHISAALGSARSVRRDLLDGTWDAKYGHLRQLEQYDAGLRLLISTPA